MITIPHKAKQFIVFLIKVLVVSAAFYFIYDQLANNDKLDWVKFHSLLYDNQSVSGTLFLLSFSFANRYLEILKWQNLVSLIKPISLGESTKQVLGALTAGIFTPNGLGEYAGNHFSKSNLQRNSDGFNCGFWNNWTFDSWLLEMGFSHNWFVYFLYYIFFSLQEYQD